MAKNEEFIKATQYYALSEDEPYNWNSEYSEFWEVFQKGMEAISEVSKEKFNKNLTN